MFVVHCGILQDHALIDHSYLAFVDMLNAMRFGLMDSSTIKIFKGLSREVVYDDGLGPTEL